MAVTAKWLQHIEAWQHSGLSQAKYCAQQQINVRMFAARLCDYRKLPEAVSATLIPVCVERSEVAGIVFTHAQGHRLALSSSVSASWGRGVVAMPGLIESSAQIWLAVAPVDMRRGLDGLSAVVQQSLGQSPCAGSAFIFRNRAGNRLRLLLWDGNGVWLCQRRLHQGRFVWPKVDDKVFALSQAQWQWLVAGVDWQRLAPPSRADWRAEKALKKSLKPSSIGLLSGIYAV
jgi:transposase